MKYEEKSPVVTRPTGEVRSGAEEHNEGREHTQPAPAPEGAEPARVRKSESKSTEGHHVKAGGASAEPYKRDAIGLGKNLAAHAPDSSHMDSPAPTPEAKQRANHLKAEYGRDKVYSESSRVPLKETLKK
jgi:hypothetical protein